MSHQPQEIALIHVGNPPADSAATGHCVGIWWATE